mmetsp:Transcript_107594/g.302958  ORF Transcript_107594/g.302958 Transcript_107594/m.302958 type:complete len:244 (-) Transcript_107594:67-798(-)
MDCNLLEHAAPIPLPGNGCCAARNLLDDEADRCQGHNVDQRDQHLMPMQRTTQLQHAAFDLGDERAARRTTRHLKRLLNDGAPVLRKRKGQHRTPEPVKYSGPLHAVSVVEATNNLLSVLRDAGESCWGHARPQGRRRRHGLRLSMLAVPASVGIGLPHRGCVLVLLLRNRRQTLEPRAHAWRQPDALSNGGASGNAPPSVCCAVRASCCHEAAGDVRRSHHGLQSSGTVGRSRRLSSFSPGA